MITTISELISALQTELAIHGDLEIGVAHRPVLNKCHGWKDIVELHYIEGEHEDYYGLYIT